MKRTDLLSLALLAFACASACVIRSAPDDDAIQREIDRVVCAYETVYAEPELTADQLTCMYDVTVTWVSRPELRREWDANPVNDEAPRRLAGLHRHNEIYISDWQTRYWELIVLRHELLHHLLMCVGRPDPEHVHPGFAVSELTRMVQVECGGGA